MRIVSLTQWLILKSSQFATRQHCNQLIHFFKKKSSFILSNRLRHLSTHFPFLLWFKTVISTNGRRANRDFLDDNAIKTYRNHSKKNTFRAHTFGIANRRIAHSEIKEEIIFLSRHKSLKFLTSILYIKLRNERRLYYNAIRNFSAK